MKKTLSLLLLIFIVGTTFAQDRPREKRGDQDRKERREDFRKAYENLTPDQIATLKTKKMALALDLTDTQQKDMLAINKDLATKHKAKMESFKEMKEKEEKPTAEERFEMKNAMLDEQLAVQTKMKNILDEDQYKMWKRSQHKKHGKRNHRMAARK